PEPLRDTNAVRVAEVLAEPEGVPPGADVPPPPPPAAGQEALEKLAPELRKRLGGEGAAAAGPVRLEVVLARTPGPEDQAWRGLLSAQPGLVIEGLAGPVVAVLAPLGVARELVASPAVAGVRLPRAATRQPPVDGGGGVDG